MPANPNAATMRARNASWVLCMLIEGPKRRAARKRAKDERRQVVAARRLLQSELFAVEALAPERPAPKPKKEARQFRLSF